MFSGETGVHGKHLDIEVTSQLFSVVDPRTQPMAAENRFDRLKRDHMCRLVRGGAVSKQDSDHNGNLSASTRDDGTILRSHVEIKRASYQHSVSRE